MASRNTYVVASKRLDCDRHEMWRRVRTFRRAFARFCQDSRRDGFATRLLVNNAVFASVERPL